MSEPVRSRGKPRVLLIVILISTLSLGGFAVHAFQSAKIPLEVKEPLEIREYPASLSVYPGETVTFNFTVENFASVTYFTEFDFILNDTDYQAKYVTFSNHNYSIPPGTQELSTWLTITPEAPPAKLILTIDRKIAIFSPSPSPTPSPTPSFDISLYPSLILLGGGARWAARNGTSALYINWKDNWDAHHLDDGAKWTWFDVASMERWRSSITKALQQSGFEITFACDIPDNLDDYDLVVLFAYYAAEPQHEPLIRNYILNGGGIVLLAGAQCYLTGYSKDLSTGNSLSYIEEWFGCSDYINSGGTAMPTFDNPFGISLSKNDIIATGTFGWAGVTSLHGDSQPIAYWSTGIAFAFTHEYGDGRVYYQAHVD
jgi:hypothetical protein